MTKKDEIPDDDGRRTGLCGLFCFKCKKRRAKIVRDVFDDNVLILVCDECGFRYRHRRVEIPHEDMDDDELDGE